MRLRDRALRLAYPCALLAGAPSAQDAFRAPELQLELDLDAFSDVERAPIEREQLVAQWSGSLGSSAVRVSLQAWPRDRFRLGEPEDVARVVEHYRGDAAAALTDREYVSGELGWLPYGLRARAADGETGSWYLFGITEQHGYALVAECTPEADERAQKALARFFGKGVRYDGEVSNWKWSDEEAIARWQEHTSPKLHKKLKIFRTKHYIIMCDSGGPLFAKKMEEVYEKIRKVFPFDEVPGRKLMPVFVFRSKDEYVDYYASVANIDRESAARSKGHAWRDYYATYYESPNDPVHIHEGTHQVFKNRLHLSGGGSWFQEGVAEYMSESRNAIRAVVRNKIKYDEHVPFKTFMAVPSLLQSIRGSDKRGGSSAGNAYTQAASLISFLAESKFGKRKFQEFVHAVGAVPRGDLRAIEAALTRVYGVDIDELEESWKRYWRK